MEAEKIKAIQNYLSKNGVEYHDVQAELIDHFASAVEDLQKDNHHLSFQEALHRAHQKFGGQEGFRQYIEKAENSVTRKTILLTGRIMLQYLQWPYLVLSLGTFLFWYFILESFTLQARDVYWVFIALFLGTYIINHIRLKKVLLFLPKRGNSSLGIIFYFATWVPGFNFFATETTNTLAFEVYFTFLTVLVIAFSKVPYYSIKETKRLYPQAT